MHAFTKGKNKWKKKMHALKANLYWIPSIYDICLSNIYPMHSLILHIVPCIDYTTTSSMIEEIQIPVFG